MATNRGRFNELIKQAHNAAWDRSWPAAIALYRSALAELPEEASAHAALANALEETGQLEESLHEYRVSSKLAPNDPVPLAHVGQIQEKMGKRADAATTYAALAEFFMRRQQTGHAVKAWQRAAALEPDRVDVRIKLAEVYKQAAHHPQAVKEYAALAKIFQRRGERDKAAGYVLEGLALEPQNAALKKMQEDLAGATPTPVAPALTSQLGQAQGLALSRLAETVLETRASAGTEMGAVESLLSRAIDAQTHDRKPEAIELYEQALQSGAQRPDVLFNLGLLYNEARRYGEAIPLLQQTTSNPDYAMPSAFALGQAYRSVGDLDHAIEQFVHVMQIVDLQSVRREQADQVIQLYRTLADSYAAKGNAQDSQQLSDALIEFLGTQGWQDKVAEVRQHLASTASTGAPATLAEVMDLQASGSVIEALTFSEDLTRRGLHNAARDEALQAISLEPSYLPAHLRLAESLLAAGLRDEARDKYRALAFTADVRGDHAKALSLFKRWKELGGQDEEAQRRYAELNAL